MKPKRKYMRYIKQSNPKLKIKKGTLHKAVCEYIGSTTLYTFYGKETSQKDQDAGYEKFLPDTRTTFEEIIEACIKYPKTFSIAGYESEYSLQEILMLKALQEKLLSDNKKENTR